MKVNKSEMIIRIDSHNNIEDFIVERIGNDFMSCLNNLVDDNYLDGLGLKVLINGKTIFEVEK